jgi:hypothetical protein
VAILHSLPRIILDDGLRRQGHFAMLALARHVKTPGTCKPVTTKASRLEVRMIGINLLTLALWCRSPQGGGLSGSGSHIAQA